MESKMEFMYITRPIVVPWVSNNGLRVEKRTCHSISLRWETPQQLEILVPIPISPNGIGSPRATSVAPTMDSSHFSADPDLTLYEVQMKKTGTEDWITIYKGYSQKFDVEDLKPDTNLSFRMRRNEEKIWGTSIMACTDSAPPNAEDLHGAVQLNHVDMLLRIIGSCKPTYLKKLLMSHDRAGHTPLMTAALNTNVEILALLLKTGARVNAIALNTDKTALMLACFKGDMACVQLLDGAGADWALRDSSGCNAVHHAVNGENAKTFEYALNRRGTENIDEKDNGGWTPLLRSIIMGRSADIVRILLKSGADPNATDKMNTKSCILAAAMLGKSDFVVLLLEYHADATYKNSNGQSALEIAESKGYRDVVAQIKKYLGKSLEDAEEIIEIVKPPVHSKNVHHGKAAGSGHKTKAIIKPEENSHEDTNYLIELEKRLSLMALQSAQNEMDLTEHRERIARIQQNTLDEPEVFESVLPNWYTGPMENRPRHQVNLNIAKQNDTYVEIPPAVTTVTEATQVTPQPSVEEQETEIIKSKIARKAIKFADKKKVTISTPPKTVTIANVPKKVTISTVPKKVMTVRKIVPIHTVPTKMPMAVAQKGRITTVPIRMPIPLVQQEPINPTVPLKLTLSSLPRQEPIITVVPFKIPISTTKPVTKISNVLQTSTPTQIQPKSTLNSSLQSKNTSITIAPKEMMISNQLQTKAIHQRPAFPHHQHQSNLPKQEIKYPIIHVHQKSIKGKNEIESTKSASLNPVSMIPHAHEFVRELGNIPQSSAKAGGTSQISQQKKNSQKPIDSHIHAHQVQQSKITPFK